MRHFALFLGAGVSVDHPSNAPTWNQLRDTILDTLVKETIRRSLVLSKELFKSEKLYQSEAFRNELIETTFSNTSVLEAKSVDAEWAIRTGNADKMHFKDSFAFKEPLIRKRTVEKIETIRSPETLFQVLRNNLDNLEQIQTLIKSVNTGFPNQNHHAIAWAVAERGLNYIVTTNFDTYIERALQNRGLQKDKDFSVIANPHDLLSFAKGDNRANNAYILKIHGCVSDANTLKLALEDIKYFPEPSLIQALTKVLRQHCVIYWGYSARDPDILPKLIVEMRKSPLTLFGTLGSSEISAELKEEAQYNRRLQIVHASSSILVDWVSLFGMPDSELSRPDRAPKKPCKTNDFSDVVLKWVRDLSDSQLLGCLGDLYTYLGASQASQVLHEARLSLNDLSSRSLAERNSRLKEFNIRLSLAEAYYTRWSCEGKGEWRNAAIKNYSKCMEITQHDSDIPTKLKSRLLLDILQVEFDIEKRRDIFKRLKLLPIGEEIKTTLEILKILAWDHVNLDWMEQAQVYVTEAIERLHVAADCEAYLIFLRDFLFLLGKIRKSLGDVTAWQNLREQEKAFLNTREEFQDIVLSEKIAFESRREYTAILLFLIASRIESSGRSELAQEWYSMADCIRKSR